MNLLLLAILMLCFSSAVKAEPSPRFTEVEGYHRCTEAVGLALRRGGLTERSSFIKTSIADQTVYFLLPATQTNLKKEFGFYYFTANEYRFQPLLGALATKSENHWSRDSEYKFSMGVPFSPGTISVDLKIITDFEMDVHPVSFFQLHDHYNLDTPARAGLSGQLDKRYPLLKSKPRRMDTDAISALKDEVIEKISDTWHIDKWTELTFVELGNRYRQKRKAHEYSAEEAFQHLAFGLAECLEIHNQDIFTNVVKAQNKLALALERHRREKLESGVGGNRSR